MFLKNERCAVAFKVVIALLVKVCMGESKRVERTFHKILLLQNFFNKYGGFCDMGGKA